jgi:hypothetical protein
MLSRGHKRGWSTTSGPRPAFARWILIAGFLLNLPSMGLAGPGSVVAPNAPNVPQKESHRPHTAWKGVYSDSGRFLTFQHFYRVAFQSKTQSYLGGPFFSDYAASARGLKGWEDGDNTFTNYILHPLQGAVSGFILIQNSPLGEQLEFGTSRQYWRSRLKALGFSALYGVQFELGPLSEASIGNVGMAAGTMGFVDLVITPIGGFGWILAEDALDRFVIKKIEQKWQRAGLIRFVRVALNPARSFANVLRFRLPWYRRGRELNKLFLKEKSPPELWMDPSGIAGGSAGISEISHLVIFVP